MVRGLVVGAIAFGGAFAAERLFTSLAKDIERYENMRKMSGQESLSKQLLSTVGSLLGSSLEGGQNGFIASLTNDVVRYAKMKGM
jgi:hypothetical protein